jgi:cellulose synthase/poly-beta-1,6-N-acetylglucosamine synthase-like glycosyltransferase
MVSSWLVIYTLSICWIVIGIYNHRKQAKQPIVGGTIWSNSITVIIPFRNEAHNLNQLLTCIEQQTDQPHEWIFINDHSTDQSSELISFKDATIPYQIIELSAGEKGKKTAIRKAISNATTDYCLTLDADVTFHPDYIQQLCALPANDMIVLPVIMRANRFWQLLFSIEYAITQLLNLGVSWWSRPINCSGANLLFRRETFIATDDFSSHQHILSGDDMYALRAFRLNKKSIHVVSNKSLAVTTSVPKTMSSVMDQRARWMNKSGNVADGLSNSIALWALALHFSFFSIQVFLFVTGQFGVVGCLFAAKLLLDSLLVMNSNEPFHLRLLLGLLLFEITYPVYLLVLLFWAKSGRVSWKGRVIQ